MSLRASELTGRFFTTNTAWEALFLPVYFVSVCSVNNVLGVLFSFFFFLNIYLKNKKIKINKYLFNLFGCT